MFDIVYENTIPTTWTVAGIQTGDYKLGAAFVNRQTESFDPLQAGLERVGLRLKGYFVTVSGDETSFRNRISNYRRLLRARDF